MELDSPYCALDGIPELVTSVVANVLGIDESYIFVENYASRTRGCVCMCVCSFLCVFVCVCDFFDGCGFVSGFPAFDI